MHVRFAISIWLAWATLVVAPWGTETIRVPDGGVSANPQDQTIRVTDEGDVCRFVQEAWVSEQGKPCQLSEAEWRYQLPHPNDCWDMWPFAACVEGSFRRATNNFQRFGLSYAWSPAIGLFVLLVGLFFTWDSYIEVEPDQRRRPLTIAGILLILMILTQGLDAGRALFPVLLATALVLLRDELTPWRHSERPALSAIVRLAIYIFCAYLAPPEVRPLIAALAAADLALARPLLRLGVVLLATWTLTGLDLVRGVTALSTPAFDEAVPLISLAGAGFAAVWSTYALFDQLSHDGDGAG